MINSFLYASLLLIREVYEHCFAINRISEVFRYLEAVCKDVKITEKLGKFSGQRYVNVLLCNSNLAMDSCTWTLNSLVTGNGVYSTMNIKLHQGESITCI